MMSPFKISQCYISTVAFFAFYIFYAHSFPNVPGREFKDCLRFAQVVENPKTVERLQLSAADVKHICLLKNPPNPKRSSFCFVVTSVREGATRSVCHEFDLLALKIWHFTYPIMDFNVVVLRGGDVRWCLDCQLSNYDDMKRFYSLVKYRPRGRHLRELRDVAIVDLQKKSGLTADYEVLATRPSIFIDESVKDVWSIHIVNSRLGAYEPLVIIWPKAFNIYTPEGSKVYMSLRLYRRDMYFFTCASPEDADRLSNELGQYGHDGRTIFRSSPVLML